MLCFWYIVLYVRSNWSCGDIVSSVVLTSININKFHSLKPWSER